jgi:hypothetical protein
VRLVKDDRAQAPDPPAWDDSSPIVYAACPESSVPITQGRLSDEWGWTITVQPCAGTCYPPLYVMDYEGLLALQPFVGSEVRIYGTIDCGSVEGCSISLVDHFDVVPCALPTGSRRTSWGGLKSIYR